MRKAAEVESELKTIVENSSAQAATTGTIDATCAASIARSALFRSACSAAACSCVRVDFQSQTYKKPPFSQTTALHPSD